MTMFPAQPVVEQKQQQQQQQNYAVYDARWTLSSSWLVDEGLYNNTSTSSCNPLISRDQVVLSMGDQDEDDSRTNSSTNETGGSTTSNNLTFDYTKQQPHDYKQQINDDDGGGGWLRLGMGIQPRRPSPPHNQTYNNSGGQQGDNPVRSAGGLMLELNLLPAGTTTSTSTLSFQHQLQQQQLIPPLTTPSTSAFMLYKPQEVQDQPAGGWASYLRNPGSCRPAKVLPAVASSSSSSGSLLQLQPPHPDLRFIRPPRRPHSGIWFMLLPSLNQARQPSLPQLPKNYLRIKDGRMTVGLLIKYLVNKLGLDTESQVEIRCRGLELEASLTMQHVRDRIWSSASAFVPPPPQPAPSAAAAHHHIMLLHYARSSSS